VEQNERKKYSREFKLEAVRRTQVTGKSVAEVARELELPVVRYIYETHAIIIYSLYTGSMQRCRAQTKTISSTDFALLALTDTIVAFELVVSNIYWSEPGSPTIYQHRQSVWTIYIEGRSTSS